MIYLTNGNMPLNAAYADEIVQEDNSTYQLTFRFPTSDSLWERLKEETFLTADDLHGEQDFVIFEVEKKHGYIQVYANQVFTLLNNYVVNPISLDRQTGSTALSRFSGAITRNNPFSFFSDIEDRHTFNIGSKNAMEAFAKDKHSIIGQWGGDLVRHGYQVRLLKNGGSENESLFMYKKNLSSYQHKTSTKSLKTRITFTTTVKGEGEKAPDRTFTVTIDSPLINKYSQIYEDVIEVNDQDVKDEASLRKYGEQYFRTTLCDMLEDSLELEVVGQSDVPVQMFDIVSLFHDVYNLDVRKKITKYAYSPMGKKLKTIGFGQFQSGLANAIGNAVSDAVKGEAQQLQSDFERQLARELKNADLAFDKQKEELVNQFTDGLNAAKARAEEVKRELSDTIDQRFSSFNNGPLQEAKRRAEEALRSAGASSLLAQEAKRIGLDSITKLEEFKRQATSAQTALSGDLDVLKRTIANDIRPKQEQAKSEIAKQVAALNATKTELAGVKSAQANYEQSTQRRLAELTNLADGKASKSELTQTAEELKSRIASAHLGRRNLLKGTKELARYKPASEYNGFKVIKTTAEATGYRDSYTERTVVSMTGTEYIAIFYARASENDYPMRCHLYNPNTVTLSANSSGYTSKSSDGLSIVRLTTDWQLCWVKWTQTATDQAKKVIIGRHGPQVGGKEGAWIEICAPALFEGNLVGDWSPAYEDQDERVSVVESNFKQRADALDAGVNRLTEGLRSKADISLLNMTAENIRQSVKSLETDTQNKLNQKLSLAEFEVRASGIRQEILNITKDKADKTLVTAEAGKLREELASLSVGGRNLALGTSKEWSTPFTNFSGNPNICPPLYKVLTDGLQVGDTLRSKIILKYTDVRPAAGKTATVWLQGNGNVTGWTPGAYNGSPAKTLNGSGEITFEHSFKITENHLKNTYWNWMFRTDFIASGSLQWRLAKVESGAVFTSWSPAPEDAEGLITEAKATFERTAQGLRTDLSAIQEYVNKDVQRQEALQRYTREESARQATAVRELVSRDFVGKASYQEDLRGLERRFEAITNPKNGLIATQIATYKNAVDGRFADITSQIAGKANQTDFQRVQETSQLYERILGNTENGIADKVARMAMTNQLFQVEVAKSSASGRNLFLNSLFKRDLRDKYSTYKLFDDVSQTKGQLAVSIDSENQFRGVNTLKIVSTFNGKIDNQKITFAVGGNSRTGRDDEFTNKSVRFSFWAKSTVANTKFHARSGYRGFGREILISTDWQFYDVEFIRNENSNATSELILHVFSNATVWIAFPKVEIGTVSTPFSEAPEDTDEAIRTVQNQLAGSWAVQNLTSAGAIVSQINATNNQILIEAEKIRLKGKTLLDELTAIQGYFKRLFVGEGTFATLNTDILRANSITADKLVMDIAMARRFVSSDLFTDTLVAKEAFINKLRSVVVTATLLEGFQGLIGGFRFGQYTNRNGYFITGIKDVSVGMGNGMNAGANRNAFWANWGNNLDIPGPKAWYVNTDGKMYCRNEATFHRVVDFSSTSSVNFYGANSFYKDIHMRGDTEIYGTGSTPRSSGKNAVVWWNQIGDGTVKYWIDRISDRRLKRNIVDTDVNALDKINQLKMVAFDFIRTGKHEEIGLIAQEVESVLPSVVSKNPEKEDDYLHIDYVAIVPYLIKAIQELNQKIEKLEKTA